MYVCPLHMNQNSSLRPLTLRVRHSISMCRGLYLIILHVLQGPHRWDYERIVLLL